MTHNLAFASVTKDGEFFAQPVEIGAQHYHPTGEHIPLTLEEMERSALHRWESIVARFPKNRALEVGDRAFTYAELNVQMNLVAHAILARQSSKDRPIAILFDLESDFLPAIFGIWKAGHFFVWLEPGQPPARHQYMLEDSGATLIVTNRNHAQRARDLLADGGKVIIIEEALARGQATLAATNPPLTLDGDSPAYLVYTSGSTGKPKGTIDNHRNLMMMMVARQALAHSSTHDRVNLMAMGSGWSFATLGALLYGGCLLPYRAKEEGFVRYSQWLIDRRITMAIGGSVLRPWLDTLDGSQHFPTLRLISLGAAPCYLEHLQAYQRYLPDTCLFLNTYSATEVRSCTLFVCDKKSTLHSRLIPAGYPTLHGAVEIWDDDGRPLPAGETGEIIAITPYAAVGYWKSPELTASRFGVDARGRRYYRMGDLGRLDEDGCLWVLGRKDGQVKIRGNRVETAEVEVALMELPSVKEVAVIPIGESDETRVLVAYVTANQEVTGKELRKELASRLPDFMVPATIVVLEQLPCNANGKVDRPALRAMQLPNVHTNGRSVENANPILHSQPVALTTSGESKRKATMFDKQSFHPTGECIPVEREEIELSVIHRWEKMVARFPQNRAIEEGDRALTYAELNAQMNLVAHAVLARQLSKEIPVAILYDIEGDLITSIFGIWKAGHFFVWLEPSQPVARNQFIVEDAEATLIITSRKHAQLARSLYPDGSSVIVIEDMIDEVRSDLAATNPLITSGGTSPAYLLYTSGSTGKPKGTVDLHRNLVEAMFIRQQVLHFSTQDRVALLVLASGWSFAGLGALLFGGCLLPFRGSEEGLAHFSQWLIERRITIAIAGSLLRTWLVTLDGSQSFPNLRVVLLGAGPTYREHFLAYQRFLPNHTLLLNSFSATEVRSCTLLVMDKNTQIETRNVPVGYPSPHVSIEIWDENGNPLPTGQSGEIVAYTPYAALGYWKLPELTAARFGTDEHGRRYYRTGDLGRLDDNGCLWILGRLDGQVKIRSHRVETAEVEIALRELPGVQESAVVVIGESDETRVLIAYVASKAEFAGNELRKQLALQLPDYMVPSIIVVLEELPTNSNGKVARPLLRDMAIAFAKANAAPTAPAQAMPTANGNAFQSKTEEGVASLINELFEGVSFGRHDNFFDMGGHSLLAARLMLNIHRKYGVDLTPRDFLAEPTVAGLAARIDRSVKDQIRRSPDKPLYKMGLEVIPLMDGIATNTSLFVFPGGSGARDTVISGELLYRQLRKQWPIYGFAFEGKDDSYGLFSTMEELVEAAITLVRQVQPHGPYSFLGFCIGGKVAYSIAQALRREGEEVTAVLLLDTPAIPRIALDGEAGFKHNPTLHERAEKLMQHYEFHRNQVTSLGWREGAVYLAERAAALLPSAILPKSAARQQYLVHRLYPKIVGSFVPKQPFDGPAIGFFTPSYTLHRDYWQQLIPTLEVTNAEGTHLDFIPKHIDLIGSKIRKALGAVEPE
jgi:amino acid adenylation domain-containing protein